MLACQTLAGRGLWVLCCFHCIIGSTINFYASTITLARPCVYSALLGAKYEEPYKCIQNQTRAQTSPNVQEKKNAVNKAV